MKAGKFVTTACASIMGLAFAVTSAMANPPGIDPGKMLFKFNVIAKPGTWDPGTSNACNGSRIFFAQGIGGNTLGTISWTLDPYANNFSITDCNGTDGAASVVAKESVNFYVAIRVLGPKKSSLNLVCTEVLNATLTTGEDLCIIDSGKIAKGSSFTKVMKNVADNEYENVLWTLSGNWKIFDVRVYATN